MKTVTMFYRDINGFPCWGAPRLWEFRYPTGTVIRIRSPIYHDAVSRAKAITPRLEPIAIVLIEPAEETKL